VKLTFDSGKTIGLTDGSAISSLQEGITSAHVTRAVNIHFVAFIDQAPISPVNKTDEEYVQNVPKSARLGKKFHVDFTPLFGYIWSAILGR
jgi:hypothetical protein